MISLRFDSAKFQKDMKNLVDYSVGFVEGIEIGKKDFFNQLGPVIAEQASEFIDMNARVDYKSLHHVYEWYNAGDPGARLFNIKYTVSNLGLSFLAEFSQSRSVQQGSNTPFFDKARIMESGQSVRIAPVRAEVLRFEVGGEEVYTKKPVIVENPGGETNGQFANAFDLFFGKYFTQAFLRSTGLAQYFSNPSVYKHNLNAGKKGGKSTGRTVGSRWVANAGKVA
jgi:hypothetical protein